MDGSQNTSTITRTGAQWLLQALEAEGCDVLFGYPGGAIMPVYDALVDSPIRHILVRHEQGAALAADGYARASGKVGVCLATSGPGATNLLTGIANAYLDSVPMVPTGIKMGVSMLPWSVSSTPARAFECGSVLVNWKNTPQKYLIVESLCICYELLST